MDVRIEMSFQQNEMVDMDRKYKVPFPLFVAGYGAGKSFTLVYNAVRDVLLFPGCKVGVYAPTHDLLALNLVPAIEEYLDSRNIKHKMNHSRHIMHLPGRRQLIFRSMNDPARIVAYEVYRSHVDEVDLMVSLKKSDEAWNRIIARNRQKRMKKNGRRIHKKHFNMVSGYSTPEGYKFTYQRWKKGPGEGYKYVVAPTRSNWNLDESFIKNLEDTYTPAQCKAYLEGLWTNIFTGSVYSYYDRDDHNTKRVIMPGDVLHIGQDFNFGGSCGAVYIPFTDYDFLKYEEKEEYKDLFAKWKETEKQILDKKIKDTPETRLLRNECNRAEIRIRELESKSIGLQMVAEYAAQDTEQIIETVQDRFPNHRTVFYPDASGDSNSTNASKSDIAMLKTKGFEVKAKRANPRIEDRINSVQRLLYNNRYRINKKFCPRSSEAMEEHAFSEITGKPEKFTGPATIDDRNDAAGYCPAFLYPIKKTNTTYKTSLV